MSRCVGSDSVSWQSSNLTRDEQATLRCHWQALTGCLAAPGVVWEWSESGLSDRLKRYLSHHDLIVQTAEGWESTLELWMFMIENAASIEEIGGKATGQDRLPIDVSHGSDKKSRIVSESCQRSVDSGRQTTLGGGEAVNDDEISERGETEITKSELEQSRSARACADDAQSTLTGFDGICGEWDGPSPHSTTGFTRASETNVYDGEVPLSLR